MSANWDQEVSGVVKHEIDIKLLLKVLAVAVVGIIAIVVCVLNW